MHYSILYEENQEGYLLNTFSSKLYALELYKSILDDFIENDYIFSNKTFRINDRNKIQKEYYILSHKKFIISNKDHDVLFVQELENGFLYYIKSSKILNVEELSRMTEETVKFLSKNLDEEINIPLN